MKPLLKRSAFDLLKIGIGPSSSHTLGPMRMALAFREELLKSGAKIDSFEITLLGSLALTGEGHLSPNAIIAGLMGFCPVNSPIEKIQGATLTLHRQQGFFFDTQWINAPDRDFIILDKTNKAYQHPNTAEFKAFDSRKNIILSRRYASIGGGVILSEEEAARLNQRSKQDLLGMLSILKDCNDRNLSLLDFGYEQETLLTGEDRSQIQEKLIQLWQIMADCVQNGLKQEGHLPGKLNVRRRARRTFERYMAKGSELQKTIPALGKANIYALAVSEENASGGRIITAPTCGACGVLPGVLYMLMEERNLSAPKIADALMIASIFGNVVVDRASISGAEVGCQGEVGVACAMSAAAVCFLGDGTNLQIESAAEAALEHHLGLTCDPVAGLVQIPCIERNAIAAGTAINTANLALLEDGEHLISFDRCVDTMKATGSDMSEKYKETSLGGLATTHC